MSLNKNHGVYRRSREEYIQTIQKPSSWGGAIELAIFAKQCVLSKLVCRLDPDSLIIDGHYDAAASTPTLDAPTEFQTSIFPVSDTNVTRAAKQLVKKLKEKHYYTDTQNFDLRCQVSAAEMRMFCAERGGLKGEQGAREHAIKTGPGLFDCEEFPQGDGQVSA
ncbi:hypothetical protein QFC19_008084 [Naganishia cerealis]|uniref:Uncharacterized protein n=1 Tax=Naganishia cerealis TaxID=610337 RepID=A0ACC2V4F6_9TREE|nr:hypothetical protein QFC19_008084 [Naganishia cerealis]